MNSPYRDYSTNDVPPEEDHDEPYSSGLWGGVALTGAFVMLVLAAFAIKEMMTWLLWAEGRRFRNAPTTVTGAR